MRNVLFIMLVGVFLLATSAQAWQGRMNALGDPYGAVEDSGDLLIHPSLARDVDDLTLFTFFNFGYTGVPSSSFEVAGNEYNDLNGYEGQLLSESGVLIPLGTGTLGILLTFEHDWSAMDGELNNSLFDYEMQTWDYLFAGSLLYGVDVTDDMGIGLRLNLSYNRLVLTDDIAFFLPGISFSNYPSATDPYYGFPIDGAYGDAAFALSVDGDAGDISYALTVNGGFYFAGYSSYEVNGQDGVDHIYTNPDMNIGGWHIGGDAWLRFKVDETITVPVTFMVDYAYMTVMSAEPSLLLQNGVPVSDLDMDIYLSTFELGPAIGIDYVLSEEARLGAVFSYTYSHRGLLQDLMSTTKLDFDHAEYAHTLALNLNGEYQLTDNVGLACGFNVYYAFLTMSKYNNGGGVNAITGDLTGGRFGLDGSLGLTVDLDGLVLEPYVSLGYSTTTVSGEDDNFSSDIDMYENNWFVFTGITLAYDGF